MPLHPRVALTTNGSDMRLDQTHDRDKGTFTTPARLLLRLLPLFCIYIWVKSNKKLWINYSIKKLNKVRINASCKSSSHGSLDYCPQLRNRLINSIYLYKIILILGLIAVLFPLFFSFCKIDPHILKSGGWNLSHQILGLKYDEMTYFKWIFFKRLFLQINQCWYFSIIILYITRHLKHIASSIFSSKIWWRNQNCQILK